MGAQRRPLLVEDFCGRVDAQSGHNRHVETLAVVLQGLVCPVLERQDNCSGAFRRVRRRHGKRLFAAADLVQFVKRASALPTPSVAPPGEPK
eukprot:10824715-Alexandrium_andersonii.AAC.1